MYIVLYQYTGKEKIKEWCELDVCTDKIHIYNNTLIHNNLGI